ncbi:hypothetical protein [Sulfitobacter sp. R18_1]|uniref:hypothetical protein n=1 Tax=Sulfitobacter sp. R18_1 TaxID=2821104 RepID=UPI001ADA3999|nr:hypothetical protein [Sulfitobacter sp. R18_1]MBO9428067.1 hypothetical protein [Sulfitobacter sp. R18_1]
MPDTKKLDLEITLAFPDGVDTAARERKIVAAGWEDCASFFMGVPTLVQITIPVDEIGQAPGELLKLQNYLGSDMPDAEVIDVGGDCMDLVTETARE